MMKFCPQKLTQHLRASSDGRHKNAMRILVGHNRKMELAFIAPVIVQFEKKLVRMSNRRNLPLERPVVTI